MIFAFLGTVEIGARGAQIREYFKEILLSDFAKRHNIAGAWNKSHT